MAQVFYSPNAIESLDRKTIRAKLKSLTRFPELGPMDREQPEYRELFIAFGATGCVARYRLEGRLPVILAIRHAREAGYDIEK